MGASIAKIDNINTTITTSMGAGNEREGECGLDPRKATEPHMGAV